MSSPDYYQLLGLSRDANHVEIKKGYHRQALLHHPDKNPNDANSADRFKLIAEAYKVLSDPIKRANYDAGFSSYAFTSSVITPEYLKAEVDVKKVKLNEEVELTFSFPGEGRFFKKPVLYGWEITAGPTVDHRYVLMDGHSIRETVLHYTVCALRTGVQTIPAAQIHFHHLSVNSEAIQVFVEENNCYFKSGEKAGSNPLKVMMHRMQVTSNTVYRKTIIHQRAVLLPRSDLVYWYHKVGRILKVSFAIMGAVFAMTRGESAFLGMVGGSLLAGVNVHLMYYMMGIKSKFYYSSHHSVVLEYEECGYRLGEAPHEGLFGSKRWAFVKSMFV